MQIHFIHGPAGSGKTRRCLAEIRDALLAAPDGAGDLLFVAPRQSTYLLERQLLGMGVPGFTRLEILPFDRLALRILEALGKPAKDLLSEEGRVMVLRALLLKNQDRLKAFKHTARTAGFSGQLSEVLRELQRGGTTSGQLRELDPPEGSPLMLRDKLHDLALLLDAYREWLGGHGLQDADELLIRAAAELAAARKSGGGAPKFSGVWLDGFAEMTGPEINLLAELLPCCASATLAFCLDDRSGAAATTTLWAVTQGTVGRLQARIEELGLAARVVHLPAEGGAAGRFKSGTALEQLAAHWTGRAGRLAGDKDGLNFIECTDPEAEAVLAAKLITDHVRKRQGRYREISVTVRRMEEHAEALQRAFRRHGIPFFIDHREPMGHHPLAELTRTAFSMAAHDWAHDDWMSALRTGLVAGSPDLLDKLENAALARGVRGNEWLDPERYARMAGLTEDAVTVLAPAIKAFRAFREALSAPADGPRVAQAVCDLWDGLEVAGRLEKWQAEVDGMEIPARYRTLHRTAWEQMGSWNANLGMAFAGTELEAKEWLAIVEAGLAGLTLGSIPPALDQVFVGAVDRARQPEVRLAIVLGLNAGVFPAPPRSPALLNRAERAALETENGRGLAWDPIQLASRELYYAYIACTRASERLCLSWSRRGADGRMLARSAIAERMLDFAGHKGNAEADPEATDCTRFDGGLKAFSGNISLENASTLAEVLECPEWDRALPENHARAPLIGTGRSSSAQLRQQLLAPEKGETERRLSEASLRELYPDRILKSSVSALEKFAGCAFQNFAGQQLRLSERDEFRADQATLGTLLHAILKQFHEHTLNEKKQMWRDWEPRAAAGRIMEIGGELLGQAEHAPQKKDPMVEWETRRKIEGLSVVVGQMVDWFKTNSFDPVFAELKFRDGPDRNGGPPDVPAWKLELEGGGQLLLQGSIDRLDVCRADDGRVLAAVFDYKLGGRSIDRAKLQNGHELQLLGYLAFAVESRELRRKLAERMGGKAGGDAPLEAAGAFYIPLTPRIKAGGPQATDEERRKRRLEPLTHQGRANAEWRLKFDSSAVQAGNRWDGSEQFKNHPRSRNFTDAAGFLGLVEETKGFIKQHAQSMLAGKAGVMPARFGAQKTACEYCPYLPVCRFEPVFGEFRPVTYKEPGKAEGKPHGEKGAPKKKTGDKKAAKPGAAIPPATP